MFTKVYSMAEYTFLKHPSHSYNTGNHINIDLSIYPVMTEEERDIMLCNILSHEHTHNYIEREIGIFTSFMYDIIGDKIDYEFDKFQSICHKNHIHTWNDVKHRKKYIQRFKMISKWSKDELNIHKSIVKMKYNILYLFRCMILKILIG